MTVDGYSFERTGDVLTITEGDSKAWRAMQDFAERFPTGREPQWDAFVMKHTRMQRAEMDAALKKYRLNH